MAHSARVLVANGNLQALNHVSGCLRRLGYINLLETAVDKAVSRAQAERPEVIFVGHEFSDRDCASIISDIKNDVATRDIPVFLTCGENESPPWSESWVTRFDGVIQWPFEDEHIQAHMRAGLRLGTMRAELNRRSETLNRLGLESGEKWRAETTEGHPRVLLVRGENGDGDATEDALKGFALLQTQIFGSGIVDQLSDSDVELVVIAANNNFPAAVAICEEIRCNPALFHMPILAICSGDPDQISVVYRHGATPAYSLPLVGDEIRARVSMGVTAHRLRGYMLNAYRAAWRQAVSDSATGLFSVEFFRQHLQTLVDDAFRWDKNLSLNIMAVPEIDQIWNEYGDAAATHLTKQLGAKISQLVRGEDLCARLDNTTFCIALPESPLEATSPTMQRLTAVLRTTEFSLVGVSKPLIVRPTFGSVEFRPGDTVDDLLDRATSAALAKHAA
ncbi:MAG: diguanylate cyclase [Proteobacteria bacterium]|nr:diguanylate cyclase [Pseudomonadota bacterium]MDA1354962.1 diguanylate cyclase [Pseudomonadota bacterium]